MYQSGHDIDAVVRCRTLRVELRSRAQGFGRIYNWLNDRDVLIVKADRRGAAGLGRGIPRRGRKQSVVPRQVIVLAASSVLNQRSILNFLATSGVRLQVAEASGCRGCRPFDHVLVIT